MRINDGIDTDRSSLSYASVDHLAAQVVSTGRGGFLVKADIWEAYRMVPVHPQDQHLLGVQLGKCSIYRQIATFWPKIHTKNILSSSRCGSVDLV